MSNPYEPPAADDAATSASGTNQRILGFLIPFVVVSVGIGTVGYIASIQARHQPYVVLTGPFWYLQIADDVVGGAALAAFCLTGFASVIAWPRWYTALFAALAALVWFGTSFYLLVLTAPD